MALSAACKATVIGSFPHREPEQALSLIMECIPAIPAWPQLPYYPEEGMTRQYNEGLPGLTVSGDKAFFDTAQPQFESELLQFYEGYLEALEIKKLPLTHAFGISPGYARGFHSFLAHLTTTGCPHALLKGQVTGPITLATSLTDQNGKLAYYDERLREAVVKTISLKARWQIHQLAVFGVPVLLFIDEPSLAAYGSSAFLGISGENVGNDLQEVIDQIHGEGAFAGIHCCENTDWGILLGTDIDILSFDAYGFFDRMVLYAADLLEFINRGKMLAWGLVPTDSLAHINGETALSLIDRWRGYIGALTDRGFNRERLIAQSLLTPSCGTGSLTTGQSATVMKLLKEVSENLQEKIGKG